MYLLDTVVLSELRKPPRQRNRNLVHWIGEVPSQDLFLSVLTIGEIERGVERQRQLNPEFAERITSWLELILRTYESRILAVDIAVARRWGWLSYHLAISATALEHGLTVATRNVSDFEPTGVPVFNPFNPRSARKP
jgi:predicted nucleic acid-binding protein